jgi:hypothetical protein
MTRSFEHFAAIDWSGARGERHRGIAVALCDGGASAPQLVRPGHRWSRPEVLAWLTDEMPSGTLCGCDLSMSFAHADHVAYFPGSSASPADAHALWALVEGVCSDEPHLAATTFADHPDIAPHFRRHGGRQGASFEGGRGRFRKTEHAQARAGCRPYSNFNLVGAAQVGKGSMAGMRLMHRLSGKIAIWPFDPLPKQGSVLVEIYTTLAAIAAGRTAARSKMRSTAELNIALAALDSQPVPESGAIDDHSSDALLTAAWLRHIHADPQLWSAPPSAEIAATEGWTLGAV